jgi:hypothetical protein
MVALADASGGAVVLDLNPLLLRIVPLADAIPTIHGPTIMLRSAVKLVDLERLPASNLKRTLVWIKAHAARFAPTLKLDPCAAIPLPYAVAAVLIRA